jgi:hypothetical protein
MNPRGRDKGKASGTQDFACLPPGVGGDKIGHFQEPQKCCWFSVGARMGQSGEEGAHGCTPMHMGPWKEGSGLFIRSLSVSVEWGWYLQAFGHLRG